MSAFERDPLTGLATGQGFNQAARELIDAHPSERFVVLYGDIDRFKVFNDRYGTEAGDRLLTFIGAAIKQALPANSVAAHLRGDHFVCCLPERACDPDRVLGLLDSWLSGYPLEFAFFVRIGIYRVDDPSLDVSLMTDRALLALRAAKSSSDRYAGYDDSLRESVVQEQELAGQMTDALKKGQFELYFQPQYHYGTGQLAGAEVLARWNHPEKGIIGPGDFIPVFERTGLVSELDYYIWAEACRCLRTWLDAAGPDGARRVPRLSVNLSRKDIYRADLRDYLVSLVEENDIPFDLLHLEITESSYMEDPQQLTEAVALLQEAGFVVEMDDFGSGYSSLNALKDVPVDVLKLDLRFLDARNDTRGGVILASVVRMARWLDLPVIAEGVESPSQARFLASVGCDTMQGFLFSKPIDRVSFERLVDDSDPDCSEAHDAPRFGEESSELWDADSLAALVFSKYAGPAALVECDGGRFELIRSNEAFLAMLGLPVDVFARTPDDLFGPLDAVGRADFDEALERAVGEAGAGESELLVRGKGEELWVRVGLRRMSSTGSTTMLLVLLNEITEDRTLRERRERAWQDERFRILSELTHAISFDYDSESDTVQLYIDRTGNGMELQVIPSYLHVLGTEGRTEVHPDDVATVKSMFERARTGSSNEVIEYRADYYGTGYRWYRTNLFVAGDARGSWHLVGLIDNIQAEHDLRVKAERDAVTGLSNHASTRDLVDDALADARQAADSVLAVVDLDDFKAVNDTCGHLKGDELLREVASILRSNCRETDIVGRVGGDEFVVLLKHIGMDAALRKFASMRSAVERVRLDSPGAPGSVSISVGVTQTTVGDREYRSVFSRADKALYEAKRAGKNQVRVG